MGETTYQKLLRIEQLYEDLQCKIKGINDTIKTSDVEEKDPLFKEHIVYTITKENIDCWNNKCNEVVEQPEDLGIWDNNNGGGNTGGNNGGNNGGGTNTTPINNPITNNNEYNLVFKIRIDEPIIGRGVAEEFTKHQKTFRFIRERIGNVVKVDWGNGVVEDNPTNKMVEYTPGEYTIQMKLESIVNDFKISYNHLTEIVKFPGLIDAPLLSFIPNNIDLSNNKIKKGGFVKILTELNNNFPSIVELGSFKTNKFKFLASNQNGHLLRDADSGNSKGYYRTLVAGLEYLKTTAEEERNNSRNQEELDLAKLLIDKNWFVQMSFDFHHRVTMPYNVKDIFADAETGDSNLGCEVFHNVPTFNNVTNELSGRIVRVNLRNGYWNDERFTNDAQRQIVPQKIYIEYQFKKPGENSFGHGIVANVIEEGGKMKIVETITLDRDEYPIGTEVRSFIWGKSTNLHSESNEHCSKMFVEKNNHLGVLVKYNIILD